MYISIERSNAIISILCMFPVPVRVCRGFEHLNYMYRPTTLKYNVRNDKC